MSTSDGIQAIEDEPYQGLYHGVAQAGLTERLDRDHLPDRFDLAEILRKTRESKGLSLEQVSEITRVRRAYLAALEQAAYDVLPPRAFAIGYVKAYAKALHLDEETLADMFKRDVSDQHVRLHAPSGASLEDVKPNYQLYITIGGCLVAAVVVWNVLQHNPDFLASHGRGGDPFSHEKWSIGVPIIHDGAIFVTKPAPAPKDQDIPAPYVTPGLEDGFASIEASNNVNANTAVPVQDVLQARKAFNQRGAIYGAEPENSAVTLQAVKSVNLVVRGADGTPFFAQQLAEGQAYRLPLNGQQDLTVEVSDPTGVEVYYNGEFTANMDTATVQVGRLNGLAASQSATLDARQAAAGQVSSLYKNMAPPPPRPQIQKKSDAPILYMPAVKRPPVPVKAPAAANPASTAEKSAVDKPPATSASSAPPPEPAPADNGQ